MAQEEDVGITGGVRVSFAVATVMFSFFTIALYNVIELNFIIFMTFKRYSGLYFWSFVVGTWGIAPHAIGFILKFFDLVSIWPLPVALVAIGFVPMVTGQSLALYSRLHLIVRDGSRIRWVLYMIVFNAAIIYIPIITLAFGVNCPNPARFLRPYLIYDKLQIVLIFLQEAIISVVYIYEAGRLLSSRGEVNRKPIKRLLIHLLVVSLVVLILDITLLGVQFAGDYEIQVAYKSAVYSVKLKIEFSVLNSLINIIQNKSFVFDPNSANSNTLVANTCCGTKATKFNGPSTGRYSTSIEMNATGTLSKDNLKHNSQLSEFVIGEGHRKSVISHTGHVEEVQDD
jgi:hypothetical protein